jgi:hypothetical protein
MYALKVWGPYKVDAPCKTHIHSNELLMHWYM